MTNEEIFNNNINIAYKVAQKYKNTFIEFEDLTQMCLLALWKATITFDFNKKIKFSTYAYRVIQNELLYYIRQNKKHLNVKSFEDESFKNLRIEGTVKDEKNTEEKIVNDIYVHSKIERLNRCKNYMTEKQKKILELRLQDYRDCEISRMTNITRTHVSNTIKGFRKWIEA